MNTAANVDNLIERLANSGGVPLSTRAWEIALACVGWPYVYSAWGAECTPEERKKRYGMTDVENIRKACQVMNGSKNSCSGCKWFPGGERVRCFDCRGFTDYVLKVACQFDLYGDTVASQWGHAANWCAKGKIGTDPIPHGVLVCLMIYNGTKWTHTGLYLNGATCECSSGVQHFETMKTGRWTHWAVAACFRDEMKEAEDVAEGTAVVTGKRVALRAEPSKTAKILTRINTGEIVQLAEEPPKEWDYVEYKGRKGWMMREFLNEG